MSRRAYPASPPIYQDPEQLAAQVARTDDALGQWRITSVQRRVAHVAAQKRADDGMRRRRRRVTLGAVVFGLGSSAVAAALVVWQLGWPIPALAAALERGWDGVPAPGVVPATTAIAPTVAPDPVAGDLATVVSAAVSGATEVAAGSAAAGSAEASGPTAESVPTAPPAVAVEAVPAEAVVADGAGAGLSNPRVWRDDVHQWAGFDTTANGLVQFKYLDGDGAPVLEPMGCPRKVVDGVRHCSAGRTLERLRHAVEVGAAAGAWSVLGCVDAVCNEVGRFDVP